MALPLNPLKTLLLGKTVEEMYQTLKDEKCLTSIAISDYEGFMKLLEDVIKNHRNDLMKVTLGVTGENSLDMITSALNNSIYLNSKGLRLNNEEV